MFQTEMVQESDQDPVPAIESHCGSPTESPNLLNRPPNMDDMTLPAQFGPSDSPTDSTTSRESPGSVECEVTESAILKTTNFSPCESTRVDMNRSPSESVEINALNAESSPRTVTKGSPDNIERPSSCIEEDREENNQEEEEKAEEKLKRPKATSGDEVSNNAKPTLKTFPSMVASLNNFETCEGSSSKASGNAMMGEARDLLQKSYITYKGKPVGTLAAQDTSAETSNYNQQSPGPVECEDSESTPKTSNFSPCESTRMDAHRSSAESVEVKALNAESSPGSVTKGSPVNIERPSSRIEEDREEDKQEEEEKSEEKLKRPKATSRDEVLDNVKPTLKTCLSMGSNLSNFEKASGNAMMDEACAETLNYNQLKAEADFLSSRHDRACRRLGKLGYCIGCVRCKMDRLRTKVEKIGCPRKKDYLEFIRGAEKVIDESERVKEQLEMIGNKISDLLIRLEEEEPDLKMIAETIRSIRNERELNGVAYGWLKTAVNIQFGKAVEEERYR